MADGNPAERLHRVLARLSQGPPGLTMAQVLSELATYSIETDNGDEEIIIGEPRRSELLQLFGSVVDLPAQCRVVIDRLPAETEAIDLLLAPLKPIEEALNQHGLRGQWKAYKERITPEVVSGLEHMAAAFSRNGWTEQRVSTERLAGLHEQVAALFDDVRKSELDDDLKRFVLRHLDRIERGIRHFQVEGSPPLVDAIDLVIGDIVRDSGENDRRGIRKFIDEDAIGRKLMRIIGEVNGVITLVNFAVQASTTISLPHIGG